MNKIYKVIWSKVRNCYVAVSEIAKRNGKSCTSVNCGAKATRGHAGVALAIALSLSMAGGGIAWAAEVKEVDQPSFPVTANTTDTVSYYKLVRDGGGTAGSGVKFTVGDGGKINYITSATSGNIIEIKSGGEVVSRMEFSIEGGVSNNKITVEGNVAGGIRGGKSENELVTGNIIEVKGSGSVGTSNYIQAISGGYSKNSSSTKNTVEISGGTVEFSGNIVGGSSTNGAAGGNSSEQGNTLKINNGNITIVRCEGIYGGLSGLGDAKNNTVTIGNSFVNQSESAYNYDIQICGGYIRSNASSSDASNNTVTISGTEVSTTNGNTKINASIYGAINNGTGNASNNTVIINGGIYYNVGKGLSTTIDIGGAYSSGGNSQNNNVIITAGQFGSIYRHRVIYGGLSGGSGKNVSGNNVILAGGNFWSDVSDFKIVGGYETNSSTSINNNTVNLYGNVSFVSNNKAELYGYYSDNENSTGTGNELHIGGIKSGLTLPATVTVPDASPWTGTTNNRVKSVNNFNKIVLHKVKWSTKPVLAAGSFSNIGKLDISGMAFTGTIQETNAYRGKMKLLASDTNNDFSSLSLTYNKISDSATLDGAALNGTATLNSTHPSQIVKVNNSTKPGEEIFSDSNNVRFWYRPNLHRVSLDSANNYKNVIYSIADEVRHIAFLGAIGWSTEPALVADSKYDFSEVEDVYVKPLSFTFTPEQAGALSSGSSMTLLSNAKGLAAGKTITYDPNDTTKNSISQSVNYSIANVASLTGTLTGTVATVANAVEYTASSMTLDTVNFGSWNGSASGSVPSGWTASGTTAINALNLMFTGLSSTVNTNPMNNSMTLLSGATGITGNHITQPGSGKGIVTVSGYNDNNGVTFDGKAKGTVSVSSNNVIYTINSVAADKLTLGSFAWGGAADTMPTGWTASVSTTIDDTNFAYTGTANTKLKQNDTAVILNATGLTTNSEVIRDSGASATKTVAMDFTDSSGDGASSIRFTGTAKGHVEAAADKVNYVVDGATLDSIDLASWNGTTFNLDSTTWGWELADTSSAVTATVATAGMTEPSGLSAGEKKVIIEATGTDYFDGINIGEGNKWSAGTTLTDTAVLTSGGVTIAGTQTKAGVKVNEANKKQLVYEASKKNATSITLGKNSADASSPVTYVKNGTARSFDNTFDVSNADIYADNLTFTDAGKALMETNDTMTIVDASGAIANSITGQKLQTFVGKTYVPIAFTDTITGKNLTFAGAHTDTLTQSDDTAKSKLIYTVGAKNVTTATLSGDITWGDNSVYYENE